jgi:hypothetical protein
LAATASLQEDVDHPTIAKVPQSDHITNWPFRENSGSASVDRREALTAMKASVGDAAGLMTRGEGPRLRPLNRSFSPQFSIATVHFAANSAAICGGNMFLRPFLFSFLHVRPRSDRDNRSFEAMDRETE